MKQDHPNTTPEKRPGRPPKDAPARPLTPFGAAVVAALAARKAALREGPRSMSDLCAVADLDPGTVKNALAGRRSLPTATEAAIRAALPELA